ncbi:substrate-binding periplasmic protein [Agarivorans sp. QJM3NY_25]|uniref:substrate-binding periplasmic protein n=1 Tax=Agarivorans sp. QJM3NY_25 TaxID=3421430 RepID=UPI003D7F0A4B
MKKLSTGILFALLLYPSFPTLAPLHSLILSNGEWEPYLSVNLKHGGVASHIVSEAFKLQGIEVHYQFFPWKRAYLLAELGEVDGSLIWSYNDNRAQQFLYSADFVIEGTSVFFHLKNFAFDWHKPQDLYGVKFGGAAGYKYQLLEKLERQKLITIDRSKSDRSNFARLLRGYIQVFQLDKAAGYYLLQQYFNPNEIAQITHHPKSVTSDRYYLIISKQTPNAQQLIAKFNRGLSQLKQSGRYQHMLQASLDGQYMDTDMEP